MTWDGNRYGETWTFRRVTWPGLEESEDYGNVTGGSAELSALSDLRASCSFSFVGGDVPEVDDMVRIYYSFRDDNGETHEAVVGTFLVSYEAVTYEYLNGEMVPSGTIDGRSVLTVPKARMSGRPLCAVAGDNPVQLAIAMLDALGISHNNEASDYVLTSTHVFERDDTWLTVINWLLASAGYQALSPDAYGGVEIKRYVSPEERGTEAVFGTDGHLVTGRYERRSEWLSKANVCHLAYESEAECLLATATLASGAQWSLSDRGYEVTMNEDVAELSGETAGERLSNLEAMAANRLMDNGFETVHISFEAPYYPIRPGANVMLDMMGRETGSVSNVQIPFGGLCKYDMRRTVPRDLEITTESEALWTA